MKKLCSILMAAALLGTVAAFAGCDKAQVSAPSTEPALTGIAATTQGDLEDDLALPQSDKPASTTKPLVTAATTTKKFQEAPIMQAIADAQKTTAAPTTTVTVPQTENEPASVPTTAATTTQPAGSPDMLNNYVLQYIRSGTYTETISAFGNDHSSDDKLSKIVRDGQTAYWITIPAAGLTFKTFPMDGKYYLATPSQYCELTKSQYDSLCSTLGNAFCNFEVLQYQKTESAREGLRTYTCEYFDMNGSTLVLWFSKNALTKMQLTTASGTESLPMSVSGSADSAYFTLDQSLENVEYAKLEPLVSLAGVFFGA
ncbi:MAG: hypothetical protein PUB99_01625 [Oscillospiraceae bacterium]|nr:hypothetical protein [Oscillospiraceae bacterium]